MNIVIPQGFPRKEIKSATSWVKGDELINIVFEFSDKAKTEVKDYIQDQVSEGDLTLQDIQSVVYKPEELPTFISEIESVRAQVDEGIGFVVFPTWENLNIHQSRVASWLVDNAFGEPQLQDKEGRYLIEIFNIAGNSSMKEGSRYHETNEGNSPHTDGAQVIDDADYLCLRCVSQSLMGGENILVSADSIYNYILVNNPELLQILSQNFCFEARGVNQQEGKDYYEKPILQLEEGRMRIRFLDHYMYSGHDIAGKPMTSDQLRAIEYINNLFEQSDLQFRAKLKPGQQLIFANKRLLHARTAFVDQNPSPKRIKGPGDRLDYDPSELNNLSTANRIMDRTWSHKRK